MGLLTGGGGGLYPGGLRNELKLAYHYILSYIYNTFIVCHNKCRIYFKNIYKTDLCDCLKGNAKGINTLTQ